MKEINDIITDLNNLDEITCAITINIPYDARHLALEFYKRGLNESEIFRLCELRNIKPINWKKMIVEENNEILFKSFTVLNPSINLIKVQYLIKNLPENHEFLDDAYFLEAISNNGRLLSDKDRKLLYKKALKVIEENEFNLTESFHVLKDFKFKYVNKKYHLNIVKYCKKNSLDYKKMEY